MKQESDVTIWPMAAHPAPALAMVLLLAAGFAALAAAGELHRDGTAGARSGSGGPNAAIFWALWGA